MKKLGPFVVSLLALAVISFFVMLVQYGLVKMVIKKKKSIKGHSFLMAISSFDQIEIISFSIITIRELYYGWCLAQGETMVVYLIILFALGTIYNMLNRRFFNIIFDAINVLLLYAVIMLKNIFLGYLIDVAVVWHVVLFLVVLILFGIIYSLFMYFKDMKKIIEGNQKRLYRKK